MIGIYKITSPSGKIYIGQSVNIKRRIEQHKYSKLITPLCRSFNKYGFENHKIETIEQCDVKLLNERERYWQDYFDATGAFGLNCILTKSNDKSGSWGSEQKFNFKLNKIDKKPSLYSDFYDIYPEVESVYETEMDNMLNFRKPKFDFPKQ
tara:strand:- start:479 stop:931 length:453 start_codon:yes stop_codon:yes gene_type:complete